MNISRGTAGDIELFFAAYSHSTWTAACAWTSAEVLNSLSFLLGKINPFATSSIAEKSLLRFPTSDLSHCLSLPSIVKISYRHPLCSSSAENNAAGQATGNVIGSAVLTVVHNGIKGQRNRRVSSDICLGCMRLSMLRLTQYVFLAIDNNMCQSTPRWVYGSTAGYGATEDAFFRNDEVWYL